MSSQFNDVTINGRATQTLAATDPNHLIRKGEAEKLVTDIVMAEWSATEEYPAGRFVPRNGSIYLSTQPSEDVTPEDNPDFWLLMLESGADGASSYVYVAYASDSSGTGFSLTPSDSLHYVAFKVSATPITSPAAGDFTGLWFLARGAKGDTGDAGDDGDDGASAYLYIAYASDNSGTGFSLTPSDSLNYIAVKKTTTAIVSPGVGDFTGLWKKYGAGALSATSPLTLTAGVLAINAASANTASYVVQRDSNGDFSGRTITATTSVVISSATLSFSSSKLQINQPVQTSGLTLTGFSGVLKATAGVVAGSATTDDLTEGSTNKYFTAAGVRSTVLTGLSSEEVIAATDTILAAFATIDGAIADLQEAVGGSGAFTVPVTITPAVATSGSPNILTVTGAANTTLTASTEASDVVFNLARVVQWATGALGTQRAVRIEAPSYAFVATSTLTTAVTLAISGAPIAWSNATITNAYALKIAAGAVAAGNTNAFGLFVDAPTGASNNYCAIFNSGNVGIGTAAPTSALDVNDWRIRIRQTHTPSSSSESGQAGELFADATYLYYRTATSTVKRIAWSTF